MRVETRRLRQFTATSNIKYQRQFLGVSFFIMSCLECHLPSSRAVLSDVNSLLLVLDGNFPSTYQQTLILLFSRCEISFTRLLFQKPFATFPSFASRFKWAVTAGRERKLNRRQQEIETNLKQALLVFNNFSFYLFFGYCFFELQRRSTEGEARDVLCKL